MALNKSEIIALKNVTCVPIYSTEIATQNQEYFDRSQAFQNEAHILRQNLDEKDKLYQQALVKNQTYEDLMVND